MLVLFPPRHTCFEFLSLSNPAKTDYGATSSPISLTIFLGLISSFQECQDDDTDHI